MGLIHLSILLLVFFSKSCLFVLCQMGRNGIYFHSHSSRSFSTRNQKRNSPKAMTSFGDSFTIICFICIILFFPRQFVSYGPTVFDSFISRSPKISSQKMVQFFSSHYDFFWFICSFTVLLISPVFVFCSIENLF